MAASTTHIETEVWYFAYGSNMASSVMERRGMKILAAKNVAADSHILNFDVFGVPYSEPAMAGISERPADHKGPPVHGVAYLLSRADYRRMIISEGAGIAYREILLTVGVLEDHEQRPELAGEGSASVSKRARDTTERTAFVVQTLVPRYPFRPNACPSTRYLTLLIGGARERGLPTGYISYLESLPRYTKSTTTIQDYGVRLFLAVWMSIITRLMRFIKGQADRQGHVPDWMGGLVDATFRTMWWYHENIHRNIWGSDGGRVVNTARM